ncbi:hypothetical protein GYM96_05930 [Pseudomonas fragi]|uniref:hypothetical protein n=1 Tax=Pseudomonas fragi TaxID=296 RepID=UPI00193B6A8E|nr:hypothetical protein [Pseudomonas fragi]MBM1199318.1 hypothetical protein [Pseudomonas fragi]
MRKEQMFELINADSPPDAMREACFRLVDYVFSHDDLSHLTFTKLARVIDTNDPALVLKVAQYVAGASVQLLDMRFELIEGDDVFYLDDEYIEEYRMTGKLMHPGMGVEVEDVESKIYPYFVPSKAVVEGEKND